MGEKATEKPQSRCGILLMCVFKIKTYISQTMAHTEVMTSCSYFREQFLRMKTFGMCMDDSYLKHKTHIS